MAAAGRSSTERQLSAGGTVRSVTQKVQAKQWVIVEQAVRRPDNRLAVSLGVIGKSQPWLEVVLVGLNSFLQAEQVVSRQRQSLRWFEFGWEFDVIADAEV